MAGATVAGFASAAGVAPAAGAVVAAGVGAPGAHAASVPAAPTPARPTATFRKRRRSVLFAFICLSPLVLPRERVAWLYGQRLSPGSLREHYSALDRADQDPLDEVP